MSESEQEAEPESENEADAATDAAGEHTGAEDTGEHASQKTGQRSECRRCGREEGLVSKYGIFVCRQCFREIAREMGFKKYR